MEKSARVPAQMQEKFDSIWKEIAPFCDQFLDAEYKELAHLALAALSRKRPSPLLKGKENSWAAGVVHALGMINFLFDKSQTPHCVAPDIYTHFGVGASTGQAKSKEVRELLDMSQFSAKWMLPSRMEDSPLIWMLEVNGFTVDIRRMPLELQEAAYQKGLIPYVPGHKV